MVGGVSCTSLDQYNRLMADQGVTRDMLRHKVREFALVGGYRHLAARPRDLTWSVPELGRRVPVDCTLIALGDIALVEGGCRETLRYDDPNAPLILTDLARLQNTALPPQRTRNAFCRAARMGPALTTDGLVLGLAWLPIAPNGQHQALRLSFTLASSQYATMLIRELTKMDTSVGAQAAARSHRSVQS